MKRRLSFASQREKKGCNKRQSPSVVVWSTLSSKKFELNKGEIVVQELDTFKMFGQLNKSLG